MLRLSTTAAEQRWVRRLLPRLTLCVSLMAAPGWSVAAEVEQTVRLAVADFEKLGGGVQFDRLGRILPELVHAALLPYPAIATVPRDELDRKAAELGLRSNASPEALSRRSFEREVLYAVAVDYVLWGEFTELDSILQFSGVLEKLGGSNEQVELGPVHVVEPSQVLIGMDRFSRELVQKLSKLEQLGYGVRSIAVLCFDDRSPEPSPDSEWIGDNLVDSLESLLTSLPTTQIVDVEANNDLCDDATVMLPIVVDKGIDAVIGGSYRLNGDELAVSPAVFVANDEWVRIAVPEVVKPTSQYLSIKYEVSENIRDLFAGILEPTGKWRIADELEGTDITVEDYLNRARDLLESEGQALALVLLKRALDKESIMGRDAAEAHYLMGRALLDQQRYSDAEVSFKAALEEQPRYADAYVGLGNALLRLERRDEAQGAYKAAVDLGSGAEAYKSLGNLHLLEQNFEDAREAYRAAVQAEPEEPEGYYLLGVAFNRERRWDEAVDWLERALAQAPGYQAARDELAGIYQRMGHEALLKRQLSDATEAFSKEIELAPTARAFYGRGLTTAYAGLQEKEDAGEWYRAAIDDYRRAVELAEKLEHPERFSPYPWAYLNIAELAILIGDYDTAREWAEATLSKFPEKPSIDIIANFLLITAKILNNERDDVDVAVLRNKLPSVENIEEQWSFEHIEDYVLNERSIPDDTAEMIEDLLREIRARPKRG